MSTPYEMMERIERLEAALVKVVAERDALRADAARYRHMRSSFARDIKHRLTWYLPAMTPMTADGLDSAIDAAIAAKEPNRE